MGVKKFFNMKPPEEESLDENRENLSAMGLPVRTKSRWKKSSKFDAFNQYARDKSLSKQFRPVGPMSPPMSPPQDEEQPLQSFNPYANMGNNDHSMSSSNPSPYFSESTPYSETGYDNSYSQPSTSHSHSSHRQPSPVESTRSHALYPETSLLDRTQSIAPSTSRQQWSPPITPISRHKSTFSGDHHSPGYHADHSAPSMSNNTLLNPYMARRSTMSSGASIRSSSRRVSSRDREDTHLEQAKQSLFQTHNNSPDTASTLGMETLHINDVPEEEDLNEVPDYASSIRRSNTRYEPSIRPTRTNYEPSLKSYRTNYEPSIRQTQTLEKYQSGADYSMYEQEGQSYLDYEPTIDLNEEPEFAEEVEDHQQPHAFDFETARQEQLQQEQMEEDEEVDRIQQEIKFTKQQSVASTRNTLRMASEAEASGQNTLGMLGAQSEKLYEIERDLLLAKTQNVVATDKVKEMSKLDRNFMLVHVANPFNSKRRMQKIENKIRTQKEEDHLIQEHLRSQQYQAENQLAMGLSEAEIANQTETHSRYDIEKRLKLARKYQFEQDDEDNDMELEISRNLDFIDNSTKRLNGMLKIIGREVDTQQRRLLKIEDSTDDLDMEIHLNNHRLGGVMR